MPSKNRMGWSALVAFVVTAAVPAPPALAARARPGLRVKEAVAYGPVALGAEHSLRLCHAKVAGDGSVRVEWLFFAVPPPPGVGEDLPKEGQPLELVGRAGFDLGPGTGNCANLPLDLRQHPEGVSIIAILIGLRAGRGGPMLLPLNDVAHSAQLGELQADGSVKPIGALLPAVQKVNLFLPAVQ